VRLTEVLGELKRYDGELNKLYSKRKKLLSSSLSLHTDKMSLQEIKEAEVTFSKERKVKFIALEAEIESVKNKVIENKLLLMKKNEELGLNEKIIKLKMIRIELSKLMELSDTNDYFSSRVSETATEELKLADKIKALEDEKRKLDTEIQGINWSSTF
jgi:hypothetical protein